MIFTNRMCLMKLRIALFLVLAQLVSTRLGIRCDERNTLTEWCDGTGVTTRAASIGRAFTSS